MYVALRGAQNLQTCFLEGKKLRNLKPRNRILKLIENDKAIEEEGKKLLRELPQNQ